jgi:hypothetical protein
LLVQTAREFGAGESCLNTTPQETMALGCLLIRHYCLEAFATTTEPGSAVLLKVEAEVGLAAFFPERIRSVYVRAAAYLQPQQHQHHFSPFASSTPFRPLAAAIICTCDIVRTGVLLSNCCRYSSKGKTAFFKAVLAAMRPVRIISYLF